MVAVALSTVQVTDAELVSRARGGDQAAFNELLARHRVAVYRAALAALGDHAEADDAAQDAFVLAWKRLADFRGDSSFRTWVLSIVWNQAINRRRSLARVWRRVVQLELSSFDADARLSVHATPERLVAEEELQRDIRWAIGKLPRKLRDALLLAQSGSYSQQEISVMLNAPVGTIKWRISEARRVIKKHLASRGYEGLINASSPKD